MWVFRGVREAAEVPLHACKNAISMNASYQPDKMGHVVSCHVMWCYEVITSRDTFQLPINISVKMPLFALCGKIKAKTLLPEHFMNTKLKLTTQILCINCAFSLPAPH